MSSTGVPAGNCGTHGWHGMTTCPRCSSYAGPFTPLTRVADVSSPLDLRVQLRDALNGRFVGGDVALAILTEWDALVNVAKAAEYAEDELRKYGTGVHLIGARHRLYDALAALNKEPA